MDNRQSSSTRRCWNWSRDLEKRAQGPAFLIRHGSSSGCQGHRQFSWLQSHSEVSSEHVSKPNIFVIGANLQKAFLTPLQEVKRDLLCRIGWSLLLFFLGSFGFYLYVRITTMHLGLYNIYRQAAQDFEPEILLQFNLHCISKLKKTSFAALPCLWPRSWGLRRSFCTA